MTSSLFPRSSIITRLFLASVGLCVPIIGCAGGKPDTPPQVATPPATPQARPAVAENAPVTGLVVAPSQQAKEILAALQERTEGESARDQKLLFPGEAQGFHAEAGGLRAHFGASVGQPSARVLFPGRATAPLHIEDATSGVGADVALVGAREADAQVADGFVIYPHAHASGAALLHRALPAGVEGFLSFEKRPRAPTVSYNIALHNAARRL